MKPKIPELARPSLGPAQIFPSHTHTKRSLKQSKKKKEQNATKNDGTLREEKQFLENKNMMEITNSIERLKIKFSEDSKKDEDMENRCQR